MVYVAEIVKILNIDFNEGFLLIKINNEILHVNYQAPDHFAEDYLRDHKSIPIDLYLVYGSAKKINTFNKYINCNPEFGGTDAEGQVTNIFTTSEFRLDCGTFEIDVINENQIQLTIGEFIEIYGGFHIFFPDTEWNREACWSVQE